MSEPVADLVPAPTVDLDADSGINDVEHGDWTNRVWRDGDVVLVPVGDHRPLVGMRDSGNERYQWTVVNSDGSLTRCSDSWAEGGWLIRRGRRWSLSILLATLRRERDAARADLSVLRAREAQVRELAAGASQAASGDPRVIGARLLAVLDGTTGSGKTG